MLQRPFYKFFGTKQRLNEIVLMLYAYFSIKLVKLEKPWPKTDTNNLKRRECLKFYFLFFVKKTDGLCLMC
jgi:hypothetical protein